MRGDDAVHARTSPDLQPCAASSPSLLDLLSCSATEVLERASSSDARSVSRSSLPSPLGLPLLGPRAPGLAAETPAAPNLFPRL